MDLTDGREDGRDILCFLPSWITQPRLTVPGLESEIQYHSFKYSFYLFKWTFLITTAWGCVPVRNNNDQRITIQSNLELTILIVLCYIVVVFENKISWETFCHC